MCKQMNEKDCHRGREQPGKIKGFREACVLLLLTQHSTYGYQLVDDLSSFGIDAGQDVGALYRLLRRLENEGKVCSQWDTDGTGPIRRLYEITNEGREALTQWADILKASQQRIEYFLRRYMEINQED